MNKLGLVFLALLLMVLALVSCEGPTGIHIAEATTATVRAHVFVDHTCNYVFDQPDRNMPNVDVVVDLGGNNVTGAVTNALGRASFSNVDATVPAEVRVVLPSVFRGATIAPCDNSPTAVTVEPDDYKGSAVKFINIQFRAFSVGIPAPTATATGSARVILPWTAP